MHFPFKIELNRFKVVREVFFKSALQNQNTECQSINSRAWTEFAFLLFWNIIFQMVCMASVLTGEPSNFDECVELICSNKEEIPSIVTE